MSQMENPVIENFDDTLEEDWQSEVINLKYQIAYKRTWLAVIGFPLIMLADYLLVENNYLFWILIRITPSLLVASLLLLKDYIKLKAALIFYITTFSIFTSIAIMVSPQQTWLSYFVANTIAFIGFGAFIVDKWKITTVIAIYVFLINLIIYPYQHNETLSQFFSTYGTSLLFSCIIFVLVVQTRYNILRKNFINSLALKKSYQLLENQKEEITTQKDKLEKAYQEIEEANQSTTDSLNYAKSIQASMLPTAEDFEKHLEDYFVFFKPRDIVSGDFYWIGELSPKAIYGEENGSRVLKKFTDEKVVITAVDCTGHGIPGAFMSMIGDSLLNQIVHDREVHSPELILNELHRGIRKALNQQNTQNRDGMDLALCVIDKKNKILEFAGAKNPLYYIQEGKMNILEPNKLALGGEQKEEIRRFSKKKISIEKPTICYIFSDGYQDQFGGKSDKKFMRKQFRSLLFEISTKPMQEQKNILEQKLKDWKGNQKQIDDILILGFRL